MWPKEEIPDEASLFMRLHRCFILQNDVGPNAFREHGGGMSVDWNKYSTALETRNRGRGSPLDNGVISMIAGAVRAIEGLVVEHAPIQENLLDEIGDAIPSNRAHSEVLGISSGSAEKKTERRLKLSRIWRWEIQIED